MDIITSVFLVAVSTSATIALWFIAGTLAGIRDDLKRKG